MDHRALQTQTIRRSPFPPPSALLGIPPTQCYSPRNPSIQTRQSPSSWIQSQTRLCHLPHPRQERWSKTSCPQGSDVRQTCTFPRCLFAQRLTGVVDESRCESTQIPTFVTLHRRRTCWTQMCQLEGFEFVLGQSRCNIQILRSHPRGPATQYQPL